MKHIKEKCGCTYEAGERQRWVELCPTHKAETEELHQRAQTEYHAAMKQREQDGWYAGKRK